MDLREGHRRHQDQRGRGRRKTNLDESSTSFMLLGQKKLGAGRVANIYITPRSEEIRTCL